MTIARWKSSARGSNPATLMSTDLNAMAAGAEVTSAEISNDAAAELDLFVDLVLDIADFAVAPADLDTIDCWLLRKVDDTNYAATGEQQPTEYVAPFIVQGTGTTQKLFIYGAKVPHKDFKIRLVNNSAQAFDAAGHTLKADFYTNQSV